MRTSFATAGSLKMLDRQRSSRRGKYFGSLETCEITDHPVVEVDKTHLSIPNVHADMEEGAVEGDKILEDAVGHELGDVEPYFMGEGIHGGGHG
jgi:hypothetical protein